jgi:hypothetical protein
MIDPATGVPRIEDSTTARDTAPGASTRVGAGTTIIITTITIIMAIGITNGSTVADRRPCTVPVAA